jgi:hypothetical protein
MRPESSYSGTTPLFGGEKRSNYSDQGNGRPSWSGGGLAAALRAALGSVSGGGGAPAAARQLTNQQALIGLQTVTIGLLLWLVIHMNAGKTHSFDLCLAIGRRARETLAAAPRSAFYPPANTRT